MKLPSQAQSSDNIKLANSFATPSHPVRSNATTYPPVLPTRAPESQALDRLRLHMIIQSALALIEGRDEPCGKIDVSSKGFGNDNNNGDRN